jgi:hypothetical protein
MALALAPRADAAVYVLDFANATCNGGFVCGDYQPIDQSYGDIAGLLDVRTRYELTASFETPGVGVKYRNIYFAGGDKVAVGGVTDDSGVPEIQLRPLNGAKVKLLQVRLVPASSFARTSEIRVVDTGTNATLYAEWPIHVGISAPTVRDFAFESHQGLGVRWGPNGINVGLDSITFEVTPAPPPPPPPGGTNVPEPGIWALMMAGFGAVGGVLRMQRRRRIV